MGTAVQVLQRELLRLGILPADHPATGRFDPATGSALWSACRGGLLRASDPLVLAARSEVCTPLAAGSGQPVPGASLLVDGVWIPVPDDVPLWIAPFHLGELKGRPRTKSIVQVILHHDAGASAEGTWKVLKLRGLSSHGSTDDTGICRQFEDLVRRVTWHAAGHVRLPGGAVVPHGFNARSVGWDISNPVLQDTGAGRADADRPMETQAIHGRKMTHLDCYPCQEEATLALLRMICKAIPTIGADFQAEASWDGSITGDTPGIWGHYHVSTQKIDPFGFPMARLVEVFGG